MENRQWVVVIVTSCDRYFQRNHLIQRDISHKNHHSQGLQGVPKGLYPLGGVPIIDIWISILLKSSISLTNIYIVSDQYSHSKMIEWGQSRSIPYHNIFVSKSCSEVGALRMMIQDHEDITLGNNILLINSDVVVDSNVSLTPLLSQFSTGMCLSYNGTLENHDLNLLVNEQNSLIFDTSSTGIHNSHLVPVYSIPSSSLDALKTLPQAIDTSSDLLRFLCVDHHVEYQVTPVAHYYPMDSLEYFDHATNYFEDSYRETISHLPSHVNMVCPARAGLMGNPSDGFHGKTLSFIVNNFFAQVTITSNPNLAVELIPHPVFDITHFQSFDTLHKETQLNVSSLFPTHPL